MEHVNPMKISKKIKKDTFCIIVIGITSLEIMKFTNDITILYLWWLEVYSIHSFPGNVILILDEILLNEAL